MYTSRPAAEEEYIFGAGESGSDSDTEKSEPPRKSSKKVKRQGWSGKEIEELNLYFKDFIKCKTTPSHRAVKKAKKSMKSGAVLLHRRDDLIVKKLSAMKKKK